MNVRDKPYPVVDLVIETFGDWLKHRRELKEMCEMDDASSDQIASDLRISSADLEQLVRQGPHAADELPKMLRALGIGQADWRAPRRSCCATWSASAPCATTSADAATSSPPAPPARTTKNIAAMPRPLTVWVRTRKADNLRHKAMKMARPIWLQISIAVVVTLVALSARAPAQCERRHAPALESASAGHRLAEAWCTDCHSIEAATAGAKRPRRPMTSSTIS